MLWGGGGGGGQYHSLGWHKETQFSVKIVVRKQLFSHITSDWLAAKTASQSEVMLENYCQLTMILAEDHITNTNPVTTHRPQVSDIYSISIVRQLIPKYLQLTENRYMSLNFISLTLQKWKWNSIPKKYIYGISDVYIHMDCSVEVIKFI